MFWDLDFNWDEVYPWLQVCCVMVCGWGLCFVNLFVVYCGVVGLFLLCSGWCLFFGCSCVSIKCLHVGVGVDDSFWECCFEFPLPLCDTRVYFFVGFLVCGVMDC